MFKALRVLFLVLVTVGAFAAVFGVIATVSVMRLAAAGAPATHAPAAGGPAPTTAPATNPAAGAAQPSAVQAAATTQPADGGKVAAPGPDGHNGPDADAPAPVVLNAADARLRGTMLRHEGDTHDLIGWARADDWVDWAIRTPPGEFHPFHVDLTYACAPGQGGEFTMSVAEQKLTGRTESTGSVKDFKTVRVGLLRVPGGKNRLALRPGTGLQRELMRLRKIELIPALPGEVADAAGAAAPAPPAQADGVRPPAPASPPAPAKPPVVAGAALATVGFTLIDTRPNTPIGPLTDGMTLDLGVLPARHLSIRADMAGSPGSVRFGLDGQERLHVENGAPYDIAGDDQGRYKPWDAPVGDHVLTATPFTGKDATGDAGKPLTVHFKVIPGERGGPAAQIVLKAEDARLHGDGIRLENFDGGHNVGFWSSPAQTVEWDVQAARAGKYTVRITFAADNGGGGGDFEVRAGDQKLAGSVGPTGGWQQYHTLDLNALTLPAGKTTLTVKATKLENGKSLMNLRKVELIP